MPLGCWTLLWIWQTNVEKARHNALLYALWKVYKDVFNLVCLFKSTTQNPLVATPCGFKSHHRHHVGMDYAPFKKPSRLAGLFSYRSVIPPFPHKTLLRKLSREPRPTGRGEKRVSILSRQLSLWNRLGKPFPGGFVFATTHFITTFARMRDKGEWSAHRAAHK